MDNLRRITGMIVLCSLLVLGGCGKPAPEGEGNAANNGGSAKVYDPTTDPLVNPPSVFEAAPDDVSLIENNETLHLRMLGSPNTTQQLFVSTTYDFTLVGALGLGLFSFDKDMNWMVNDEIVESFEESEDHTTFIVKIKPGFTWQDGHPWTAHDVVYSWEAILDPKVPCLTEKPTTEQITECVALDDYTVKFVQPEPVATRLWNLVFSIIPKHIYEVDRANNPDLMTGEYYSNLARNPVTAGAYKLIEWKENDKIVLERWEDYKGDKPYFKRVVFHIIPDDNVGLLSFEKQEIDCLEQLSAQQFAMETNTPTFENVGYKILSDQWIFYYIGWNMDGTNPFFNDKRVRYAMTHALDIDLYLEKVFYNLASQCNGIYSPGSWMYDPSVELLDYDLEKSRALLDEAGWLVDPDDGWRYKTIDGEKVKFEFTLLISQGSKPAEKLGAIYQKDLKKIGIEMKTHTLEWATFIMKIRNHEFQAETAGWGTGTDPDTGWNLWRSDQHDVGRNYGMYANPRVDELFVLGRKEFDPEKRAEIYKEIGRLIYEDQPYTFIYNRPTLAAINKRLRGVQKSPRGLYDFSPGFAGWWVPKGEGKWVEVE